LDGESAEAGDEAETTLIKRLDTGGESTDFAQFGWGRFGVEMRETSQIRGDFF
jgi:hypothetical protein